MIYLFSHSAIEIDSALDFEAKLKPSRLKNPALSKWIHCAKVGDNRKGQPMSKEMFQSIVQKFYSTSDACPVYIGHVDYERPSGSEPLPARGWVLGLHATDTDLYAFIECREYLANEIVEGGYQGASIYAGVGKEENDVTLLSIAIVNNPAVPDLLPLAASDEKKLDKKSDETINTKDSENNILDSEKAMEMLESLRAKMSETSGSEMSLEDAIAELMSMVESMKPENDSAPVDSEAMEAALSLANEQIKDLQTKVNALELEKTKAEEARIAASVDADLEKAPALKAKRDKLITLATKEPELYKDFVALAIPKAPSKVVTVLSEGATKTVKPTIF